jgi:hypothetical protein
MFRAVFVLVFAGSLITLSGQTLGDEPRNKRLNDLLRECEATTPGVVRLPSGTSYLISFRIKERKDKRFTGTITYDLGLREQVFEVEGTIDEKGMTFQEKPAELVHPHCPSLGGGKYEIKRKDKIGAAYLRLRTETTKEFIEIAYGMREPAKCEFVLGAFHIPDAKGSK